MEEVTALSPTTTLLVPHGARFGGGGIWPVDGLAVVGSVVVLGAGAGATLDAEGRGRMFDVEAGGNLTLRNLELVNGSHPAQGGVALVQP